jgi:hypothetical protein
MKILHLAIIIIVVGFVSVVSFSTQDARAQSVTVSTDKTSYHYGENYTISGQVNPIIVGQVVSIVILSPEYPHPVSISVVPNSDGRYLDTLPLKINDILGGNFTVVAQYAGAKNQTTFSYIGLPCNQLNIPGNGLSVPIIRAPASNPRIVDIFGNAITVPVKVGQQIQITYTVANGLNCAQPFAFLVQIQDHSGITVSLSWITGTLIAGQSMDPAQSWTPQYNDTYTAQIFTWDSIDNPNALAPPASVAINVEPNPNLTKSLPILPKVSTCNDGLVHIIKKEDNSPACVTHETAQKLIDRGWAISMSQPNQVTDVKTNDPFGITALIIYHPSLGCLGPPGNATGGGCPPNNFYLKINSNSTAYLMGYNICDDNSCAKNNDLSILLPINTILNPNYQSIGLPVNLQWKNGDTVNIQLEVSHSADNKTASLIDLGNSTIVP